MVDFRKYQGVKTSMKKNRIRPIKAGNGIRMSYARQEEVLEMPNLIEVQKNSYQWLLTDGLREVFDDISMIVDYSGRYGLRFVDFSLDPKENHTIEVCKERDGTYSAALKVTVELVDLKEKKVRSQQKGVFLGELPLMTDTGSFIINGAERVIVSQLVRSPGIYYSIAHDKTGKELYTSQVIPNRGAWLEYETDSNNVFYVKVDRNRKVPITVLVRALGVSLNKDIEELFGDEPKLQASLAKDVATNSDEGLLELYKKLRPGEPLLVENAANYINNMLFDPKRYDLAKVGRYKFNKKLAFRNRIVRHVLAEDVMDKSTGEIIGEKGTEITVELADKMQNAAVPYVWIQGEDRNVKVLSNLMVDINTYLPELNKEEVGITELVYYPKLMDVMELANGDYTGDDFKRELKNYVNDLIPKHITREDIFASINYVFNLENGIGNEDDIDHLGNRRIRAVGELLQNQYRIGLSRMERTVRDKMSNTGSDVIDDSNPGDFINCKPVTAAIKEFFGSSQLSQFMDQHNPLGELTHKRRLSALGPGGLSRDRAGFEVRDVHYSHYGRMCPVETPEGPNIGLINSLASYARINEYGFIEAPYRKLDKTDPNNPRVTDEVVYLTADEEDPFIVAQANEPLDENGYFINNSVSGRFRDETSTYDKKNVELMDVSPKMVFSAATAMIPFLQNDDANRALMGSNMQRQAVPLLFTDSAVVGTGMEAKVAVDSGVCVLAEKAGVVESACGDRILVRNDDDNRITEYPLLKFARSNQGTCINQRPIVNKGDHVEAKQVIADGPSTKGGEIGLGKSPLIGFMTWEGYNYEDAVLLSERLVRDDVYTSIHIEEYECEARDTKLGDEEITRDVPGVGDDALKDLNEDGIIRIGAEVRAGDILVGKVTPKGETELTAEERLLRAIFGEKAREVRDTSLRVPHGEYGIIVDAKKFEREKGDELAHGVKKSVRVYIAQKRKIQVGDKMAGRHGNKGVVSRVLPVEDMPFLPNGRPLDIVLNPLGVPSRMNIGQVLEIHLSLAATVLGVKVSTPIFDGANEEDIGDTLELANDYINMPLDEFEQKYREDLGDEVMDYLLTHLESRNDWKGVKIGRDGKVWLKDGRTGQYFDSPATVGFMNYLKLHHLVDDKIHARSTGPYSLVTQQPLGGKAQFGGQRFGEMEVWALEAYGAAYTLQEILTIKSDDVVGRVKTYEAIIKGENISEPGIPESFKVLLKELQSLALDVTVLDEDGNEIKMMENVEYGDEDLTPLIETEETFTFDDASAKNGFTTGTPEELEDGIQDEEDSDYFDGEDLDLDYDDNSDNEDF
ncbi:DNA-directed RNA polymerase, beta subunit [Catonella morbi ATCC 51271]|uniref:DNA-directed RNA polymerase subunit beta n=2 Tax=Catonella TaxID=43996 RepID=V2Y805_9FIRM|nr:DNA-directed RNA polymerase, beta subunit [Catonella morbi ATCC 51271]